MIFSSAIFLYFFSAVLLIYWALLPLIVGPKHLSRARHIFLLIASYFFYMSSVWQYGLLIFLSTAVDYVAGLAIAQTRQGESGQSEVARAKRRAALVISLAMNLGILGYFKYSDFFIGEFVDFINMIEPSTFDAYDRYRFMIRVVLPVGISFFTFQSMSYTIDVYRDVIPTERDFIRFALFVSFFPQLVAGPIVTAKEFLPQLDQEPIIQSANMREAARWFAMGYFKKAVLADNMAPIVDAIYGSPTGFDAGGHWMGALAFWVQVYCDFSGYSDMAWGTAIFLGYRLPENFRMPYLSKSVTEHWQRWHISLIRWNRDYLYIPLGGSRVGFLRHKFNIFLTMFAAGVWHGANWTYTIWGAIHGLILAVESSVRDLARNRSQMKNVQKEAQNAARIEHEAHPEVRYFSKRWPIDILKLALTSFVTIFFGTMFRSRNISESWLIMKRMLCLEACSADFSAATYAYPVLWAAGFIAAGHVLGYWLFEKGRLRWRIPLWVEIGAGAVLTVVCIQFSASGSPFIYFVF
ncbi:MAG: MBOAT family protein [Spirochaetales bacterium]|nr:MBOAT family protein [Leptospiraceae bacterium]MCP5483856.1 MBOAT family protein [Spirochaetales bacterium]MCP5486851.1 MBOAT family protein [Spirochaetales bacterium]